MTYIPEAVRSRVTQRGHQRCEYCRIHQDHSYFRHEIDHIIAEKHGGQTTENNLCLACADCNRNKGSDLCSVDPLTDIIHALFHPRQDTWTEHFRLDSSGLIVALTPTGRVTERTLRFNRTDLVTNRQRLIRLGVYDAG